MNRFVVPPFGVWSRLAEDGVRRLSTKPAAVVDEIAGFSQHLAALNREAPLFLSLRRNASHPALFDDYRAMIPLAKEFRARIAFGGASASAKMQLIWVKRLHEAGLPKELRPMPCLDMCSDSFAKDLGTLRDLRVRQTFIEFAPWSQDDLLDRLMAIRHAASGPNGIRVHALQVRHDTPQDIQGTVLANCFEIRHCVPYVSPGAGGSNSPLVQADNWSWAQMDGRMYRRFEDGAPQHPAVSWIHPTELNLQDDANVEAQGNMLAIRRQHDSTIGTRLGEGVARANANGTLEAYLTRHLRPFWERLPEEFKRALSTPIQSRLPAAP